jgi:hypothetical protein
MFSGIIIESLSISEVNHLLLRATPVDAEKEAEVFNGFLGCRLGVTVIVATMGTADVLYPLSSVHPLSSFNGDRREVRYILHMRPENCLSRWWQAIEARPSIHAARLFLRQMYVCTHPQKL